MPEPSEVVPPKAPQGGPPIFCQETGARLRPPPHCPLCKAELAADHRFCPGCGIQLVGPRPQPKTQDPKPAAEASNAELVNAELSALTRPAKNQGVSHALGSNVLVLVAIIMLVIVGVYELTKPSDSQSPPRSTPMTGFQRSQNAASEASAQAMQPGMQPSMPPGMQPVGQAKAAAEAKTGAETKTAADAQRLVAGEVSLKDGVQVPSEAVLFIAVRNPRPGPPLAAIRIPNPSFPVRFEVKASDRMIPGTPIAETLSVEAILDQDGNIQNSSPGDLRSLRLEGVQTGRKDLRIQLGPRQ